MNPRIKWLRNQLIPLKLDGIIVSNPINIRYLTGLSEEGTLILAQRENVFITDSRYMKMLDLRKVILLMKNIKNTYIHIK